MMEFPVGSDRSKAANLRPSERRDVERARPAQAVTHSAPAWSVLIWLALRAASRYW
jgi:hypothetical protein